MTSDEMIQMLEEAGGKFIEKKRVDVFGLCEYRVYEIDGIQQAFAFPINENGKRKILEPPRRACSKENGKWQFYKGGFVNGPVYGFRYIRGSKLGVWQEVWRRKSQEKNFQFGKKYLTLSIQQRRHDEKAVCVNSLSPDAVQLARAIIFEVEPISAFDILLDMLEDEGKEVSKWRKA